MSASECAARLSKPVMRGLLHKQIKVNLGVAIGFSIVVGLAMKFLYCDARKNKYAEFYKNYDAHAEFDRMRKAGLFQSVN